MISKMKNLLFKYNPNVASLEMNLENIVHITGYKNIESFPYYYLLNEFYLELKEIITPQCAFIIIDDAYCQSQKGEVYIDGITFKTEKIISSSLKKISKAALFIGTAGETFDTWLEKKKKEEDPFVEYLSSLIGSEIAERLAKWIHKKIEEHFKKEQLNCSNRYSPGYCGWDVNEQKKIFEFFPQNICGVSLTDSALMLPIKSVSGIVGIGENVEWENYPCEVCNVPFCYKNRRSQLV